MAGSPQSVYQMTDKDNEWRRHAIPQGDMLTLQAVTLLVEELTTTEKDTSLEAVSRRTGYSIAKIKEILRSPQYADIVADVARNQVAPLLLQNLNRLGVEVQAELEVSERISLNRELRQTWRDLHELVPKQNDEEKARKALEALQEIAKKRIHTENQNLIECSAPTAPSSSS